MSRILMTAGWLIMILAGAVLAAEAPVAIAIHGGAGTPPRGEHSAEKLAAIRADLEQAVRAGHEVLLAGGASVDAISAAIQTLENSPYFNAARGAVLNEGGEVEMDASMMWGADLSAGAVAGVHGVRNPITLARAVMDHSPHVLLAGEGAEVFARQHEIAFAPVDYFKTQYRQQQWQRLKNDEARVDDHPQRWFSTVGAVALDRDGHLAAGTSTGGMAMKRWGRIGDSPIIGAGTYADDRYCAVSGTGHGEYFIRAAVAHDICARVRDRGINVAEAAEQVIMGDLVAMGGAGGVIAIGSDGQIAMPFNTSGMYRAAIDRNGHIEIGIFKAAEEADMGQ